MLCFPGLQQTKYKHTNKRCAGNTGETQVADNEQRFMGNGLVIANVKTIRFPHTPCSFHFCSCSTSEQDTLLEAPWTRGWCWSLAAPRESASAWLSGWPPIPTKHSKVTRARSFLFLGQNMAPSVAFCPVYATMRNLGKKERLLESVKGLHRDTLDILQMDVTSMQSILDAKDRVVEKRVDILGMFSC